MSVHIDKYVKITLIIATSVSILDLLFIIQYHDGAIFSMGGQVIYIETFFILFHPLLSSLHGSCFSLKV